MSLSAVAGVFAGVVEDGVLGLEAGGVVVPPPEGVQAARLAIILTPSKRPIARFQTCFIVLFLLPKIKNVIPLECEGQVSEAIYFPFALMLALL